MLAEGNSGYAGYGERTWAGFGVWFYFHFHKVILIHWCCDGVLPELTAVFLWEILGPAKCLGEGEAPWVPSWAG